MAGNEREGKDILFFFFLLTLVTRQSLEFFLLDGFLLSLPGGHIGLIYLLRSD